MWIAPSRHPEIGNWEDDHWKALTLDSESDWETAFEIFEDRINYRYLDAIRVLQANDDAHYRDYCQRRFGFAMMALDCLLIETLAQFYDGLQDSDEARKPPLQLNNAQFYTRFLTQRSFVLKTVFAPKPKAACAFYRTIRCGILHQAETKELSIIRYTDDEGTGEPFDLLDDGKSLRIHWKAFHNLIKREFGAYCMHLSADDIPDLRRGFKRKMDFICRYDREAAT